MTTFSLLRSAATLSGVLLAIGLTGPVSAQTKTDELAGIAAFVAAERHSNG